jgi:uncharacterized repeat protein (TIGR03803 family)
MNGMLYGTTVFGGSHGNGTVFATTTSGKEQVVYSFGNRDGNAPVASLLAVKGKLFGTAEYGGGLGSGTAFMLSP